MRRSVVSRLAVLATLLWSAGCASWSTTPPSEVPPAAVTPVDGGATAGSAGRSLGPTDSPRPTGRAAHSPRPQATSGTDHLGAELQLRSAYAALRDDIPVHRAGVVVSLVGRDKVVQLGEWKTGPAWSTMKVPLSLAALSRGPGPATEQRVHRAITESDNAAAEELWTGLGGGRQAAAAVDAVLVAHGDPATRTEARRTRPPFSAPGQTRWSLHDQAAFLTGLACSPQRSSLVVRKMRQISPSQRWGLSRLRGTASKSGWGPDSSGRYLVRQMGIVAIGGATFAVAVAVESDDGSFEQGTAAMTQLAEWLVNRLRSWPVAEPEVTPDRVGGCSAPGA